MPATKQSLKAVRASHRRIKRTVHSTVLSGPFGANLYFLKTAFGSDNPEEVTITLEWQPTDKEESNGKTE